MGLPSGGRADTQADFTWRLTSYLVRCAQSLIIAQLVALLRIHFGLVHRQSTTLQLAEVLVSGCLSLAWLIRRRANVSLAKIIDHYDNDNDDSIGCKCAPHSTLQAS